METNNTILVSTVTLPATTPSSEMVDNGLRRRLSLATRERLFADGYSALTMDALAHDLGISKKTLYTVFPSKDALVTSLLDAFAADIRAEADQVLGDHRLSFAEKLRGFTGFMLEHMATINPSALRDLARYSPTHYAQIEALRRRHFPHIFGTLIEQGQTSGVVRADINSALAAEFLLLGVQGLLNPANPIGLRNRSVQATFEQVIDLFFGGLLTEQGRHDYAHLFPPR